VSVPLSEHEQRVLHELEQALYQQDPAFADRVRSESVYRYAGRYLKWSIAGFVAGLAVMLFFFTTNVFLGFLGVLIMFASLVTAMPSTTHAGGCATAFVATADALGAPHSVTVGRPCIRRGPPMTWE
jgi:hypothetical protein